MTPVRVIAGRYEVRRELGRGGMGIVWLAEDRTIGRRVAIKELHLSDGVPPVERAVFEERVLREARTAGRLNDPAVVTVYDIVQEAGTTYIVMELIEAPTLTDEVNVEGPIASERVAVIGEQLLSALEAAHAADVVHRDVKPSNVMLDPNGRVKLTDFGIAQSLDDPRLTTSGILVGSPTYIAPERLHGEDAGPASDLWALGATLYFAVEGIVAFERPTTASTMHAIMNETPQLTTAQGPLAAAIMGLLIAPPEARLTAPQARALLQQAQRQTVRHAHDIDLTSPLAVTARQRPGATRIGVGDTGPRPEPKSRKVLAIVAAVLAAGALFTAGWFTRYLTPGSDEVEAGEVIQKPRTVGEGGDIPEMYTSGSTTGGLCFNGSVTNGQPLVDSDSVDCKNPHNVQVFGAMTIYPRPGESYDKFPNIAYPKGDMASMVTRYCSLLYSSDVVVKEPGVQLKVTPLLPSEASWNKRPSSSTSETSSGRVSYCAVERADNSRLTKSIVNEDND
ncbi:serine/threonine-protein kinase [Herbihabitans rhizosphaerae]|uniref:serine/threonine-protein kinase n=1 Tax=Herbihabitans rhizosphaerae TaxID=1872711 RepID=UPI001F5F59DA|nr:serine/threonine-protein kinase [Herbihabitans rhizosphaerae]